MPLSNTLNICVRNECLYAYLSKALDPSVPVVNYVSCLRQYMAKYILAYVRNYPQRLCMEANLLCTYTQIVFKQTFICTLGWIVYNVYFHRHDAFHCLNQNYFFGESHFLCATLEINYGGTWINLLTPILIFFNIFLNITFRLFEYVIVISPCSSSSDRLKKSIIHIDLN